MIGRTATRRLPAVVTLAAAFFTLSACDRKDATTTEAPKPPMVTVATPVEREVVQHEFATGRVEAPEDVEIRARVSGHLVKAGFQPGTEVKAGDVLFEIDPEPYKADLAKAEADQARATAEVPMAEAAVARSEANLVRAAADLKRSAQMLRTNAISQEEYDKSRADHLEAQAAVNGSKAKVEADKAQVEAAKAKARSAKLDLDFCTIRAPIGGRVGDRLVDQGNLVAGGVGATTLLTTIVSVDPMSVSFDMDENTLQRLQKAEREGRIVGGRVAGEIPAEMGVAVHGTDYPLKGAIKFVNNRVDAKTGTIRIKAEFANPMPQKGARVLAPGMFAHVRVPIGQARKALLIPDAAILSDQGVTYALALGDQNKATRLDVEGGSVVDGYRVIESVRGPGETKWRPVRPDEKFIVSGLQRVRADMPVDPKPAAR
jgi:RND family efflux transporter MFP subunit